MKHSTPAQRAKWREAWSRRNKDHRHKWYLKNKKKMQRSSRRRYLRDRDARLAFARWQRASGIERVNRILREYGLTQELIQKILRLQKYRCAICRRPIRNEKLKMRIDHCHKTGRVRGLLCNDCNLGLGKFKDSIKRLVKAIAYLQRFLDLADI